MIVPININQKIPTSSPDLAKTYGRPRIPAPMMVPVSVKVAAQNFFFILSPIVLMIISFLYLITIIFLKKGGI